MVQKKIKPGVTFLLIMLSAIEASAAARLLNYETRVVRAAEQIERIKADRDYSDEGVSYIKHLLPRTESIEVEGTEVSVDNNWLYTLLDSYTGEKDPPQSTAKLNEIAGRLRALDEHLQHAETATNQQGSPRDEIREILNRPAYQPEQETAIGGFVKRILRKVRGFVGEIISSLGRLIEKLLGASSSNGWIPWFAKPVTYCRSRATIWVSSIRAGGGRIPVAWRLTSGTASQMNVPRR